MEKNIIYPALCYYIAMMLSVFQILPGCNGDIQKSEYSFPGFKETAEAEFEVISDELFGLNAISDITVRGSKIIVCSVSLEDGKIMHLYDKGNVGPPMHILNYGRGPKELLFASNISFSHVTGTMTFSDNLAAKQVNVNVDVLAERGLDAVDEVQWQVPRWNVHNLKLEKGNLLTYNIGYLQRDTSKVMRLEMRDRYGNILSAYNEFPVIDNDRKRFMMYTNEIIAVSPDEEKMAIASSLGGILETFSLKNGEIRNKATKYFIEPDFSIEGNRYNYDNLLDCFSDLYAEDDVIYAAYGGEVRMSENRNRPPEEQSLSYRNIAVFDWEGRALKKIRTDYRIERLCLDKGENTIYAVIKDTEGRAYIGRIRL